MQKVSNSLINKFVQFFLWRGKWVHFYIISLIIMVAEIFGYWKKPMLQMLAALTTGNLKLGNNFTDSYKCVQNPVTGPKLAYKIGRQKKKHFIKTLLFN